MMNYYKNKLINECLAKYYETFAHTLDTADYVPEKFNDEIYRYIMKNLRKQFRKINREDRLYQKQLAAKKKCATSCEKKAAQKAILLDCKRQEKSGN